MRLVITILIALVAGTDAGSNFTADWADSVKQFFRQTQQSIGQKSGHLLIEVSKKLETAQDFVEKSKRVISTVAQKLKSGSERLKATVMETAETTLRGAGDEVEDFFSEVPNRVNDGFDEILAKLGEACSWIFRNIIAPILFIIALLGFTYIFVVSGCCGCCCSTLLSQLGISLGNAFKFRLKKEDNLLKGDRIIVLRDLEASIPLQQNELLNSELLKHARILRI